MKELDFIVRGLIAGLVIAAPVGPVNVYFLQRTLTKGWKSGLACGFGAAACDTLYGAVAAFSITFIIGFLVREQSHIRFFGGLLLVVIGISYCLRRPKPLPAQNGSARVLSDLISTFLLDLANPTAVLSFLAILAALGLACQRHWALTVFLVGGIFSGSMLWWIVLIAAVRCLRCRLDVQVVMWMNRVAGLAIGAFGIALIVVSFIGSFVGK
jgi:threonine/homoserine/homoserine lactone efflux protein